MGERPIRPNASIYGDYEEAGAHNIVTVDGYFCIYILIR